MKAAQREALDRLQKAVNCNTSFMLITVGLGGHPTYVVVGDAANLLDGGVRQLRWEQRRQVGDS